MQRFVIANNKSKYLCTVIQSFLAISIFGATQSLAARDFKVGGWLTTGYERYDRQYNKDENAEQANGADGKQATASTAQAADNYDRFRISPLFTVTSLSARDEL